MNQMNVLVSLHPGYGLGDAVQMSAVLRHVAAARPNWRIDYQAENGKHQVGRGIVANTFTTGGKYPTPYYDAEVQILLYETKTNWHDRPNTRVSTCLHDRFDLDWNPVYGRYRVDVDPMSDDAAQALLDGFAAFKLKGHVVCRTGLVAIHYIGTTAKGRKSLTHLQANKICSMVDRIGRIPVVLDWKKEAVVNYPRLTTPLHWGCDAEMVCAVIKHCDAFIGIDSGPAKCASTTETPSLVIWTGHHPAAYHDPAPNTTHLVPHGYQGLIPECDDKVCAFFEANYNVRWYEGNPVREVGLWLEEVLK